MEEEIAARWWGKKDWGEAQLDPFIAPAPCWGQSYVTLATRVDPQLISGGLGVYTCGEKVNVTSCPPHRTRVDPRFHTQQPTSGSVTDIVWLSRALVGSLYIMINIPTYSRGDRRRLPRTSTGHIASHTWLAASDSVAHDTPARAFSCCASSTYISPKSRLRVYIRVTNLSRGVHGQGGGKSTSDGYDSRCSYFRRWISGSVG
jgi:hypothetical protein